MTQPFDEYDAWRNVVLRLRTERPGPAEAARIAAEAIAPALSARQLSDLQAIDFGAEIEDLRLWFRALLITDPPDPDIDAFYFGLFTECVGIMKKTDVPAMYVGASDRFDPADSYCEWACDMVWLPAARYPRVKAFRKLASILTKPGILADIVADAFVFALAEHLATNIEQKLLLGNRPWRAVGSGYDSGDAYIVGYITQDGFSTDGPPA